MKGIQSLTITLAVAFHLKTVFCQQQQDCTKDDLEYKYTECDAHKVRWRVLVPKHDKNCVMNPQPPIRGPSCDSTCEAGQYLDIDGDQSCKRCSAGTFSVGDGIRYDDWHDFPDEFTVTTRDRLSISNCSRNTGGWLPKGDSLVAVPNGCFSTITISVNLVRDGKLVVEYKNTYTRHQFFMQVKNSCEKVKDDAKTSFKLLMRTDGDDYRTVTVDIGPGKYNIDINMISFYTHGVTPTGTFAVKSIDIQGMAYTAKCTQCKAGFYSSDGSSSCTPCPENTHASKPGSSTCSKCLDTEYASLGSKECKPSPPCTKYDYIATLAPCRNNLTHPIYTWIQPKFCNDKLKDSVKLPKPGTEQPCPACNPGQALNSHGECDYCGDGKYSNGSSTCKDCPLHTEARKSLTFTRFDTLPDRMITKCIKPAKKDGSFCNKQLTWIPKGDYMTVSDAIDNQEFAVLNVNVSGFLNRSFDGKNFGSLTMKFDLVCDDDDDPCLMYLLQTPGDSDIQTISSWNTSSTGTVYRYNFTTPDVRYINLAFKKSLESSSNPNGGATSCLECALGGSELGCHRCSEGQFIATNNQTGKKSCKHCPDNHIVVDDFTCKPCGPGLIASPDYTECLSDCNFISTDGKKFNFSHISGIRRFDGTSLFTGDGSSYHATFNFALCSSTNSIKKVEAFCVNNMTDDFYWVSIRYYRASSTLGVDGTPLFIGVNFTLCSSSANSQPFSRPVCTGHSSSTMFASLGSKDTTENVNSLVCKSTIFPSDKVLSFQPISLGDKLVNININDIVERNRLKGQGVPLEDDSLTVHFNYITTSPTSQCPHGPNTTITLVCDLNEKGNGTLSFPPKCVGGTCNGCHYNLIWATKYACPVCSESDYRKIKGECVNGQQTITYIPNKYCPLTDEYKQKDETLPCTLIPMSIKIGIAVSGCVGLLLLICAICCWKRSRKLEYKYMRLVEGAQGKDGELPAAQTCAWSDDDEEEVMNSDKVAFKTKGDKLFGKLGQKGSGDGFEKMKLVGSSLPEI